MGCELLQQEIQIAFEEVIGGEWIDFRLDVDLRFRRSNCPIIGTISLIV